jgi:hypothetical protein
MRKKVTELYQGTIKNRFSALENLDDNGDMGHYKREH